jgi:hypothetical protein
LVYFFKVNWYKKGGLDMRGRCIIILSLAINLFFCFVSFSATLPDENAAKDLTNKIMTKIANGDIDNAFKLMKPYVPISATEIDSAAIQTKAQLEQYGQRYGEPIGFEFIDSTKIGDSVFRFRYLAKMKNNALPWVFIFYKTTDGWTLNNFSWKDSVVNLFEKN